MPTYVYETIPQKPGEVPRILEFKQSVEDEPLSTDPETGEPIRRLILGNFGMLTSRDPGGRSSSGSCCGSDSGCCG